MSFAAGDAGTSNRRHQRAAAFVENVGDAEVELKAGPRANGDGDIWSHAGDELAFHAGKPGEHDCFGAERLDLHDLTFDAGCRAPPIRGDVLGTDAEDQRRAGT